MNTKESRLKTILFCFITAFVTLAFTSRSSFFYITNNWDDVNSYFTMGKGMMNKMVIYRDLYDQKGPYLYLLYGIAYLISHKSFLGVFIFEVIAGTATLFFSLKIAESFCKRASALFLLPLLSAGIFSSVSFYKGGAAEEFCLPMLIYSLYVLLQISGTDKLPEKKELTKKVLIVGLFCGIITQVKYTMLGFFFGFAVVAFLFLLIAGEKLVSIIRYILFFLLSFVLSFVPWLIYFGINGALDDWYRCYVYNNIFFYSAISENTANFGERLYNLAKYLLWLSIDNYTYFIFIIIGFVGLLATKGNIVKKLFLPFIFATTFFVIFFGGNTLPYYSIPLISFSAFGIGIIGLVIDKLVKEPNILAVRILTFIMLFFSAFAASKHCISYDYMMEKADNFWMTEFKEIIEKEENPTLLNIGGLDAGLYTVTGIVPTCEYFQTNGIGLPTMFEEQNKYIKDGKTTFIIAVNYTFDNMEIHYNQIAEATYDGESYYLFKKVR